MRRLCLTLRFMPRAPRFANSEDMCDIPEWLLEDEKKHRRKPVPVTPEMLEEYKQRWKEINARPIKRVAEAKARKKRRVRRSRGRWRGREEECGGRGGLGP